MVQVCCLFSQQNPHLHLGKFVSASAYSHNLFLSVRRRQFVPIFFPLLSASTFHWEKLFLLIKINLHTFEAQKNHLHFQSSGFKMKQIKGKQCQSFLV